jgi:hypothetical protein
VKIARAVMADQHVRLQLAVDGRSMLQICLLVHHKSVVKAWTTRRNWATYPKSVCLLGRSGLILLVGNDLRRADERSLGIGDRVAYSDCCTVCGVNNVDILGSLVVICLCLAVALH